MNFDLISLSKMEKTTKIEIEMSPSTSSPALSPSNQYEQQQSDNKSSTLMQENFINKCIEDINNKEADYRQFKINLNEDELNIANDIENKVQAITEMKINLMKAQCQVTFSIHSFIKNF
jgi:hypothetical protein